MSNKRVAGSGLAAGAAVFLDDFVTEKMRD